MSAGDDLKSSATAWGDDHDNLSTEAGRDSRALDAITIDDLPPAYSGAHPLIIPMPLSPSPAAPQPSYRQRSTSGNIPTQQDLRSRSRSTPATITASPHNPLQSLSHWARVPFQQYRVSEALLSIDQTSVTTASLAFLNPASPTALRDMLRQQARLPPQPTMRIKGTHADHTSSKTDFDLLISLNALVNLEAGGRWKVTSSNNSNTHNIDDRNIGIGGGNLSLDPRPSPSNSTNPNSKSKRLSLPRRHSNNNSQISPTTNNQTDPLISSTQKFLHPSPKSGPTPKSITLHRTLPGLPTTILEGHIRTLLASLNYRGKLEITFPTRCEKVTVLRKPMGARAVVGGWVTSILNGLAGTTADSSTSTGSKDEIIIERIWDINTNFNDQSHGQENRSSEDDTDDNEHPHHQPQNNETNLAVVQSWWTTWQPAIRNAVLGKRQGKITVEDWIESQMGWRLKDFGGKDWGMDFS